MCGHERLRNLLDRKQCGAVLGQAEDVLPGRPGALYGIILGYIGEWAGFSVLFFSASLALFVGLGIFQLLTRKQTT